MRYILMLIMSFSGFLKAESNSYFEINEFQGKVVYLDFWASWCVPCRKSFPWLNDMQQKYGSDKFVVVGINLDKEKSLATEFLETYPANFTIYYDPQGVTAKQYQIPGMPSSVLFDENGKIIDAHSGFFLQQTGAYEQKIQQALNVSTVELINED